MTRLALSQQIRTGTSRWRKQPSILAILVGLLSLFSGCNHKPKPVDPAQLPAVLQRVAFGHFVGLVRARWHDTRTVFCLGLAAEGGLADPHDDVVKSISAGRVRAFPASECESNGVMRHSPSGLSAVLLVVDSAKATTSEQSEIYIHWYWGVLEAEWYRCTAESTGEQWVLDRCTLIAIS